MKLFHRTYEGTTADEAFKLFLKGLEEEKIQEEDFDLNPIFLMSRTSHGNASVAVEKFSEIKTRPLNVKGAESYAKELLRNGLDLQGMYGAIPVAPEDTFEPSREIILEFENMGSKRPKMDEVMAKLLATTSLQPDEFVETIYVQNMRNNQELVMEETKGETKTSYCVLNTDMNIMWPAPGASEMYDTLEEAKAVIETCIKDKGDVNNANDEYEIIGVTRNKNGQGLATGKVSVLSNKVSYKVIIAKRVKDSSADAYMFFAPLK